MGDIVGTSSLEPDIALPLIGAQDVAEINVRSKKSSLSSLLFSHGSNAHSEAATSMNQCHQLTLSDQVGHVG